MNSITELKTYFHGGKIYSIHILQIFERKRPFRSVKELRNGFMELPEFVNSLNWNLVVTELSLLTSSYYFQLLSPKNKSFPHIHSNHTKILPDTSFGGDSQALNLNIMFGQQTVAYFSATGKFHLKNYILLKKPMPNFFPQCQKMKL